jgi:hypothetical protein
MANSTGGGFNDYRLGRWGVLTILLPGLIFSLVLAYSFGKLFLLSEGSSLAEGDNHLIYACKIEGPDSTLLSTCKPDSLVQEKCDAFKRLVDKKLDNSSDTTSRQVKKVVPICSSVPTSKYLLSKAFDPEKTDKISLSFWATISLIIGLSGFVFGHLIDGAAQLALERTNLILGFRQASIGWRWALNDIHIKCMFFLLVNWLVAFLFSCLSLAPEMSIYAIDWKSSTSVLIFVYIIFISYLVASRKSAFRQLLVLALIIAGFFILKGSTIEKAYKFFLFPTFIVWAFMVALFLVVIQHEKRSSLTVEIAPEIDRNGMEYAFLFKKQAALATLNAVQKIFDKIFVTEDPNSEKLLRTVLVSMCFLLTLVVVVSVAQQVLYLPEFFYAKGQVSWQKIADAILSSMWPWIGIFAVGLATYIWPGKLWAMVWGPFSVDLKESLKSSFEQEKTMLNNQVFSNKSFTKLTARNLSNLWVAANSATEIAITTCITSHTLLVAKIFDTIVTALSNLFHFNRPVSLTTRDLALKRLQNEYKIDLSELEKLGTDAYWHAYFAVVDGSPKRLEYVDRLLHMSLFSRNVSLALIFGGLALSAQSYFFAKRVLIPDPKFVWSVFSQRGLHPVYLNVSLESLVALSFFVVGIFMVLRFFAWHNQASRMIWRLYAELPFTIPAAASKISQRKTSDPKTKENAKKPSRNLKQSSTDKSLPLNP